MNKTYLPGTNTHSQKQFTHPQHTIIYRISIVTRVVIRRALRLARLFTASLGQRRLSLERRYNLSQQCNNEHVRRYKHAL